MCFSYKNTHNFSFWTIFHFFEIAVNLIDGPLLYLCATWMILTKHQYRPAAEWFIVAIGIAGQLNPNLNYSWVLAVNNFVFRTGSVPGVALSFFYSRPSRHLG